MAEGEKDKFFEVFGRGAGERDKELSGMELPKKTGEILDGGTEEKALEDFNKGNQEESSGIEETVAQSGQKEVEPVAPVLEVGKENEGLVREKEYWKKMIGSIRSEKLDEDETVNREKQAEKILVESLRLLVDNFQEEIKSGDALQAVDFFKKVILKAIKEDDPEINEAEYLDKLHAQLSQVEGIEDLS